MTLQTVITLLFVGLVTGLVAHATSKRKSVTLAVNLVLAIGGAFLGWFVLRMVGPTAITILFASAGSLLLLFFVRLLTR